MPESRSDEPVIGPTLAIIAFIAPVSLFYLITQGRSLKPQDFADFAPLVLGVLGAVISIFRRATARKKRGDRSLVSILIGDFSFDHYATLSILSFLYAVVSGACIGTAVAYALTTLFFYVSGLSTIKSIAGILLSLLVVIIIRLFIEGYTVIYRTAQDFGVFLRSHTTHDRQD